MFLRNTSPLPTLEVKELVRFATAELDMRRVCVNVRGGKSGPAGRAYGSVPSISNAPRSSKHLIVLRVGPEEKYPVPSHLYGWNRREHGPRSRFPVVELNTWQEGLVYLAAHEALHIEQIREGLPISEVKAELYGVRRLEAYRADSRAAPEGATQPT